MPGFSTSSVGFEAGLWSPPSLAQSLTVAGSVALHASLLLLGGSGQANVSARRNGPSYDEVAVQVEEDAPTVTSLPMREAAPVLPARGSHTTRGTSAVAPPPFPARTTPGTIPSETSSEPAAVAPATPALTAPPRFTLLAAAPGVTGATLTAIARNDPAVRPVTWDARDVDEPARLLSSKAAVYPAAASVQGIEADVPLELVVDEAGGVLDARTKTRAGYGFDEAALEAVRGYRFAPARRRGRSVRVRLSWTVNFRLRS